MRTAASDCRMSTRLRKNRSLSTGGGTLKDSQRCCFFLFDTAQILRAITQKKVSSLGRTRTAHNTLYVRSNHLRNHSTCNQEISNLPDARWDFRILTQEQIAFLRSFSGTFFRRVEIWRVIITSNSIISKFGNEVLFTRAKTYACNFYKIQSSKSWLLCSKAVQIKWDVRKNKTP